MIRRDTIEWRWVLRLTVTVLALGVGPVLLGILLDRLVRTSPIITLFMMLLGFSLGIASIARSVGAMYARHAAADAQSPSVGGDR